MKYRNKVSEFKVWQWKGYKHDDIEGLYNFFGGNYKRHFFYDDVLVINSYRYTPIHVNVGDYIIKNEIGDYYPIPQDIFEKLFEKIE